MAEKKSTLKRRAKPRPEKAEIGEHIDEQRRRLLRADAVIICIQRGIDSMQAPPDEIRVGDALQVASDIINRVVEELKAVSGTPAHTLIEGVRPGDPEGAA